MSVKSKTKNFVYFFLNRLNWFWQLLDVRGLPILMYHSVADNPVFFTVKPRDFTWQMAYLAEHNYHTIFLRELNGGRFWGRNRAVALTFDDGYQDNYRVVFPLLKKYGCKATIFLATDFIGGKMSNRSNFPLPMLTWGQIKEMADSGLVDFQPHSSGHYDLNKVTPGKAQNQILRSKAAIEQQLGGRCTVYAYPRGRYSSELSQFLQANGFVGAVTTTAGLNTPSTNPFRLKRNSIDSVVGIEQFCAALGPAMAVFAKLFH